MSYAGSIEESVIAKRRAWAIAARPRTLPAAIAPVIVGTAAAIKVGMFQPLSATVALLVALLLQVAANLANDGFDFARGADTDDRVGPLRVTQRGLLSYREVMLGTAAVAALAVFCGSYLAYRGGWPILLAGIIAVVVMLGYTGGPVPLGYHGLGEVAVFVFFGLVGVCGTYYVQALSLSRLAGGLSIAVGALTAAILVANNLRDIHTDRRANKRTLAVLLGARAATIEYGVLLTIAYIIPPTLWLLGLLSGWWVVAWLSLPIGLSLVRAVSRERGALLNRRLAQTAQLVLLNSLLLGLAVIL